MPTIRLLACRTSALCFAWPLLLLQLQPALEHAQEIASEPLPLLELPEGEPLVLPGVVLEEIPEDSALRRAGLQPGDVILSWERLPNPPFNPEGASGTIENPFDWMWLEIEQAPRGVVSLSGKRNGLPIVVELQRGPWLSQVLPRVTGELSAQLEYARQLDGSDAAARQFSKLAAQALRVGAQDLAAWFSMRTAELAAKAENTALSHSAYQAALGQCKAAAASSAVLRSFAWSQFDTGDLAAAEVYFRKLVELTLQLHSSQPFAGTWA